jgi:hypothetical protein
MPVVTPAEISTMTAQQPLTYDAFVELAAADPAVVGPPSKGPEPTTA